jgi:lambda family phage portal protein
MSMVDASLIVDWRGKRVPLRQAIHELWEEWTDQSDADGQLDFYGQESQTVRGWLEGGDMFVRLRPRLKSDGLSVPLQIQVIEPELGPHGYDTVTAEGTRVRAGIEFDAIGRRVGYWFHPSRPGDIQDYDRSQLRRVPASAVIHLNDPLRAGQLRGLPLLTQAIVQLFELAKFRDAALIKQQLAAMFVGFLTHTTTPMGDAERPAYAGDVEPQDDGDAKPTVKMEPGYFNDLAPGEDVKFATPPSTEGYADFVKQQLRGVSASTGVPYEVLTGDMSGLNDRVMRVVLNDFRRRLQAMQHQIIVFQFCRPIFRAWLYRAFLADALPLPSSYAVNPEPFARVKWMPQAWPYLNPVQDIDSKTKAIRGGLTSRSAEVSETGEDAEAIDAQQAADNQRADGLGLKYASDGRLPINGPATPQPKAATV